jgi:hypothetical protein
MGLGDRVRLAEPTPSTEIWRGTVVSVTSEEPHEIRIQWDHTLFPSSHPPSDLKEVT